MDLQLEIAMIRFLSIIILIFSGVTMAFTQVYIDTIVKSHSKYNWAEHGVVLSYYNLNSIDYQSIGIHNKDSILTKYSSKKHELYFGNNPLDTHTLLIGNVKYKFDPINPTYRIEEIEFKKGIQFSSLIKGDLWSKEGVFLEVDLYYSNNNCFDRLQLGNQKNNIWIPSKTSSLHHVILRYKNHSEEELLMKFHIVH